MAQKGNGSEHGWPVAGPLSTYDLLVQIDLFP